MPFQGNDGTKDYSSYYFADHCLQIQGGECFSSSPLTNFADKQTHTTSSKLLVEPYDKMNEENSVLVAQESGVSIFHSPAGRWILKGTDPGILCRIETDGSYSELKGFVAAGNDDELNHPGRDSFLQLLRIATESFLCNYGGLSVHAACVKHKEKAILFIGPSGTGKSTQASFWIRSFGASLLSGDRPHLHIRSDKIEAYGVPWDGKEQQFMQDSAPVAAIVEIRQAKSNRIRALSREQAFRLLARQTFIPMWDDQAKFSAVRSIRAVANRVPFYRLFCNLDDDAVALLESAVFQQTIDSIGRQEKDMRIKEGFILRNIVDEWIVMPKGTNIKDFEGAIVLNEVSAHIWKQLETPVSKTDLLQSILDEFEVSESAANTDLDEFLGRLRAHDMLIEE